MTTSPACAAALLLLAASTALAQAPPCKGHRSGDPGCVPQAPGPAAPAGPSSPLGAPVPKALAYALSVTRVGAGDVVEFTPVQVAWTLSVSAIGIVGPAPVAVDVAVCPTTMDPSLEPGQACARVGRAAAGKTYHGTLSVPAPPAGRQSPLRIVALGPVVGVEDYGQRAPLTEASVPVDVQARYEIAIDGFEVITTRSTSSDTVWISLNGMVRSTPPHFSEDPEACKTVGFTGWCQFNQPQGTVGDGHHDVTNVRVGPYELVPERETDLRFLFYVDNHDHNPAQEIFVAVANGFSKAGMLVLSAYGAASGNAGAGGFASQLDSAMEQMHSSMAASCDGELATDVVVVSNTTIDNHSEYTLDALTRGTGAFKNTAPAIYRNIDGDLRCDRRGGAYRVAYAVERTSWRDWGFRAAY